MNGQQESRAVGARCRRRLDVHADVVLAYVDHDGPASCLDDRLEGRDERHGRHHYFFTPLQPERQQRQPEGIETTRNADARRASTACREVVLELLDLRTVDEHPGVDELRDVVEQRVLDLPRDGAKIHERHRRPLPDGLPRECGFGHGRVERYRQAVKRS